MADDNKKAVLQSVANALDILDLFNDNVTELGVTEISQRMGIGKSTAFRLATTLVSKGYLDQDAFTSKYRLGLKLMYLSRLVMNRLNVIRDAHPYLVDLSSQVGETVHLVLLNGYSAVFADKIKGTSFANMGSSIGVTLPAHGSAGGKVLLSSRDDSFIQEYLDAVKLEKYTFNSITSRQELLNVLSLAKANGYAEDKEETEEGLRCVAMPVRSHDGAVIAAVSISGAASRMERNFDRCLTALKKTTADISRSFGYNEI